MYDVAIIGAGIIGTSIAREISKYEISAIVIEKTFDIANGATKANSGIVHAGFDAVEETLKAKLNVRGSAMYEKICKELNVPYRMNGSLVVACDDNEMRTLEKLYERGIRNGVKDLEIIDKVTLNSMEQNITENAIGALRAGTGGIVSPYELAIALGEVAYQNGVDFRFNTEVTKLHRILDGFLIETSLGEIKAKYVVNAAGIFSEEVNRMLGGEKLRIIPRRGEYCLLDKSQKNLVKSTIFKVPTDKGKGILITPTVHGNILIGPNAIVVGDKEDTSTTAEGVKEILSGAQKSINGIEMRDIITSFSGLRATPDGRDFIINIPVKGAVNAAGIESPGLTAAPAISEMVMELLESQGLKFNRKPRYEIKRKNVTPFNDLEYEDKMKVLEGNPLYGRIICRCEGITEADIINSIRRPLGAKTVDSVKRRIRPGGGRCQGGFCMPRVVEILARELGVDQADILKAEQGSFILSGRTK
jgi:glycerol-3-phosphate dehydrogenase